MLLLYDPKEADTFFSSRWKTSTNPDLAFARMEPPYQLPLRGVAEPFPLHLTAGPFLIFFQGLKYDTPSNPASRWNFRKANWQNFTYWIEQRVYNLPTPDKNNLSSTYQKFCDLLISAAKKFIPRGRRKKAVHAMLGRGKSKAS